MKKQIVTVKSLIAATALLVSGISLAVAQTAPATSGSLAAELYPSSISGDLAVVRTPDGAAAYTGTTAPVIRHHAVVQRKQR
jgi:hypothetical protein